MSAKDWDVERYEAGHSYVWNFGRGLLEWLAPQPANESSTPDAARVN